MKDYKVEEMNPPREGKGLLVLDVDYTLFGELHCHCHWSQYERDWKTNQSLV